MNWFALLLLLEAALAAGAPEIPAGAPEIPAEAPAVPAEAGIFMLGGDAEWVALERAPVAETRTRGLKTFIETGGYTRFFVDIAFEGEKAVRRTTDRTPRFFCRGPFPAGDALIVRLDSGQNRRLGRTSPGSSSTENKQGFPREDLVRLRTSAHDEGSFLAVPEDPLPPGEYLLVTGDVDSGRDFGVD